jgi:glycosyltransferase involved in cell wall biosynthesis
VKLAAISHLASPDAPTGAEKSLCQLVGELSGRGHEAAVVAPGPWCLEAAVRESGAEVVEIRSRGCWLVQAAEQPLWKQGMRYARFRLPDPGFRRMMVWLDAFWPDVVLVNCLPQAKGAAAARALGLPVVWHIREILPPSRRRRWFAHRLKRDATRIVAVSHAVADWLAQEGLEDMVEVVHNGCQAPTLTADVSKVRADLGLSEAGVIVGFFAQIIGHKGTIDLVRAGSIAMAEQPGLQIVIAGDGPESEKQRLRDEIARSSRPEGFVVLPPVQEIWDLLAAVDMAAVPSLWPDPLPRTVMEAMAVGKPVVAYDTGGVAEMVVDGETGFMVQPGNVEGLADRMVRLAGDSDLRRRFGTAAAERARAEFSLSGHLDRMERILMAAAEH